MAVAVDEPGHDPVPGGIDDVHGVLVLDPDVLRQPSYTANAVALNDNSIIGHGRVSCAIDQRSMTNDQGF